MMGFTTPLNPLTVRLVIYGLVVGFLIWVGVWFRGQWELDKQLDGERNAHQTTQNQAAAGDAAALDRIKTDGRIDGAVNQTNAQLREEKRNDSSYREYLDRPLPDATRRLYRDAAARIRAAEHPGADGAGAEADPGDR